ncbi:RNA polymerase sigma factor [Alteromonas flava]|uniref:RNA polymerase sigma factor n=1 Tax=Alteromonas flava TaxID=2048003 RepID=UPI000C2833AF|nr:sigma-70 family RNA polymerase sigma factor [Alteromonas flava]
MQQHKAKISDLAQQHGKLVFHCAYRLLADTHLAEDVTQDVFIKLFKKPLVNLNDVKNWPAYLKTLAVSTAIDYLRKNKQRAEDTFTVVPEKVGESAAQPLNQVLQDRDLTLFTHALLQLTEQDAQIYCLRHVEGYSYQEISELMHVSSNLVGVSLHRSQIKLSTIVGQSQFLGASHEE